MQEYEVVTAETTSLLVARVNRYLQNNWKVQGGIIVYSHNIYKVNYFAQTLIRDKV